MKKVFENILASNDIQTIKNCVATMADCCEVGMNVNALDYERKIFDECISFLNNGELPYHDLKV